MGRGEISPLPFLVNDKVIMRLRYLIFSVAILMCAVGCRNKIKQEPTSQRSEYIRPASVNFTQKDSSEILALVNHYVERMKQKDYANAFGSLYYLSGRDSVKPLTKTDCQKAEEVYRQLPIHDCDMVSFSLKGNSENVVKVGLLLTSQGSIADGKGVMYIGLRPVKMGNKWYLTFLDNDNLRIKEMTNEK